MSNRSRAEHQPVEERRNTIGMSPQMLEAFLDRLDAMAMQGLGSESRSYARWPLREAFIDVCLQEHGTFQRCMVMATRNVSNGGIAVLHSSYMYPGSKCTIALPSRNGQDKEPIIMSGRIARCVHREGMVHEIGIKFDEPIDASRFVAKLMPMHAGSEVARAAKLTGTVLQIDASPVDRRLIEYYLSVTKIKLITAGTFAEAKKLSTGPIDLILSDMLMPDGKVQDYVRWLRNQCNTTPVTLHTATPMAQVRQQMQTMEVQGLLTKPVERGALLAAMIEFLSAPKGRKSVQQSKSLDKNDPTVREIIELFRSELDTIVGSIEEAFGGNDSMAIYAMALRLSGTAPTLGFDQLGKIAGRTAELVAATMSCEESSDQIRALIQSCKDVKAA
ncbi:MAG: response regulator [Phycisphaerales bacterium]|nr:response regulator [Phycisphaerales bacterium]MCB9835186.1 response regulator [Phycisphaera sp.]